MDTVDIAAASDPGENQSNLSEGTPLALNKSVSPERDVLDFDDDSNLVAGLQTAASASASASALEAVPEYSYDDHYRRPSDSHLLTIREHAEMALKIAPWWFISNYFYNLSLKYTTIT